MWKAWTVLKKKRFALPDRKLYCKAAVSELKEALKETE